MDEKENECLTISVHSRYSIKNIQLYASLSSLSIALELLIIILFP